MEPATGPDSGLTLSARTAGSFVIAELSGELDITCSPVLREQLLGLLRRSSSRLVLDLSEVTYCDASGLAVLVGTGRRARLLGGFLRLAAVSPPVDQVLHITGLRRHLDVFATVLAATASPADAQPGTIDAATRDQAVRVLPQPPSKYTRQPRSPADSGGLREATAALLTHADAWRDADPSRRFAPALQAIARAGRGGDDTALETAARSLISALARHPLTHTQAVAASATRLRHVFDEGCRPAVT